MNPPDSDCKSYGDQFLRLTVAAGCSDGRSSRSETVPQNAFALLPPDLAKLVAVWPSLPPSIRAAIHAMVDAFDTVEKK
ncbi:MAG: hypothetical protein ACRDD1_11160 [Planctomycetia bacterium]